jgi:capsular polysaccharide transport system permease protein
VSSNINSPTKHSFTSFDELLDAPGIAFAPTKDRAKTGGRIRDAIRIDAKFWFGLFVLLPTLVTAVYYLFFAADQYYSEAAFVVRSASKTQVGAMDVLRRGVSGGSGAMSSNRSDDDAYAVRTYILSRDAVMRLDKSIGLRELLGRPEADWLARFPRLPFWSSFEDLYRAYQRFVDVTYDETSGITTIGVTGFRPKDAQTVAATLMSYAEDVVNRMNDRAERDALSLAGREVERGEQRFAAAETAITQFRNTEMMVDPADFTKEEMTVVAKLAEDTALAKARLLGLQRTSPNSPDIPRFRDQIHALDQQIDEEQGKLAGSSASLAPQIAAFAHLKVAEELARHDLSAAHESLHAARVQAEQQRLYLEPVVQPLAADYALYPRRLVIIVSVFAVLLIVYGLGWLLAAGVREHTR